VIVRPFVAAALGAETVALVAALTLVVDFRAHRASEQLGGVNIWGYRGAVMLQKAPNEIRIAVVGGTLAFGWGVAASETLAPNLAFQSAIVLDAPGRPAHRVTGVNLGAEGLSPPGYASRLESYRYLLPDIVCIYIDPPGLATGRAFLPREESVVFASTGYVPMLPLVLIDKGTSTGSSAMAGAGRLLERLDRVTYRALYGQRPVYMASGPDPIEQTVRVALRFARGVVVIAPPYTDDSGDVSMHQALAAMVASTFHDEPRVRFIDLGDVDELADDGLKLDELNFSAAGHSRIAGQVAPVVLHLIQASRG